MLTHPIRTIFQWICPPQVFDFWMEEFNLNYRWQRPSAKVIHHEVINNQYVKLQLKPNSWFKGFQPGQHLSLSGQINGLLVERCYSIINQPNKANIIELCIKIQGQFSQWVSRVLSTGSVIDISQAWGSNHQNHYDVYIAGGIGITAILPLVKNQLKKQSHAPTKTKPTTLIYLANQQQPWIYKKFIQALEIMNLNVIYHDGRQAINDKNLLLTNAMTKGQSVLCCGSASFNAAIKEKLKSHSIQLDFEHYNLSQVDNSLIAETKTVNIFLRKSKRTLISDNKTNLLKTLMDNGVQIKQGCRQGICHQCSCQLHNGEINQSNKIIHTHTNSAKVHSIQPCIALAQSDIELEL